jgi:fructosamine-3-kinase
MINWQTIEQAITAATGKSFKVLSAESFAGGDINTVFRLLGKQDNYFVKLNRPNLAAMFEAEMEGLQALAAAKTIRVPEAVAFGQDQAHAFLVMEYIDLKPLRGGAEALLGQRLAQIHAQQQGFFGWHRDNTIGLTPQQNCAGDSWTQFWQQQRLGMQLKLAAEKGYTGRLQIKGEELCAVVGHFFSTYQPQASLLHGDLWGGNAAADSDGQPVIFDPACYFGDREADIAMTELFGGYGAQFYAAYNDIFPLDAGYATRKTLYNLYHILNHLNLFGSGYLSQAQGMIDRLLAEVH